MRMHKQHFRPVICLLLFLFLLNTSLTHIHAEQLPEKLSPFWRILVAVATKAPSENEPAEMISSNPTNDDAKSQNVSCTTSETDSNYSTIRPNYFKWWKKDDDLVRGIIRTYGGSDREAWKTVEYFFQELELLNEDKAIKWRDILEYWDYVNHDMELNNKILPDGLNDTSQFCLIAPGYMLLYDGTIQEELLNRLEMLLDCANQYPNAYILCSGGGKAVISEAEAMANWLIEHGIENDRIILEEKSSTTDENILFSYRMLTTEYPDITEVAIVSSDYHVRWGIVSLYMLCEIGDHPLTVVSHAACPTQMRNNNMRLHQMEGMLTIFHTVTH